MFAVDRCDVLCDPLNVAWVVDWQPGVVTLDAEGSSEVDFRGLDLVRGLEIIGDLVFVDLRVVLRCKVDGFDDCIGEGEDHDDDRDDASH